MIDFRSVSKKYGRHNGLSNISFSLEQGKIYGLLGPNGSGKSTALKLIAGLVSPTSGQVIVKGKEANRKAAADVIYLTEVDIFYPSFKIKDMIDYYDSQFQDFSVIKARELLDFMNLEEDRKIKNLSKGNRGRLKLVLALSRQASVLLLDEPFSGLDPMVRDSIVKGLLSYIDFEKQTVIIATHEIDEIEPLLDDVIALSDGEFLGMFNVEELREKEGLSIIEWMRRTFKE
ncbi:ABC-2 type transport system ATP-binding protein [Cytobacillus horneckiae]|uniref:ABC transporter ATP-binding protein n=1 Tax=Cytobacillus horneckiae TaxID=549687 RepID=A0A2N0ZI59_9BACI|nr:ABC transporter ATP-binding protein [Cytobacillus horneckiae]MBN6887814.1 ABC transporter ATP-binding protein [Cytobacillus horneckiae]MCM3179830.1 ABC transporter ATP-binding protein [Cytobacillus horneckiae]MEC1155218.1 ABC transporter ATP-binding protein [Cytobacillus horneckiae]MED2936729.1 ABC transporter ATP-binding protein [Cytobacillus horneckiae]PKG29205.1 ABC transporter ATP-binding protein [Cytobacillus horneckiae]